MMDAFRAVVDKAAISKEGVKPESLFPAGSLPKSCHPFQLFPKKPSQADFIVPKKAGIRYGGLMYPRRSPIGLQSWEACVNELLKKKVIWNERF